MNWPFNNAGGAQGRAEDHYLSNYPCLGWPGGCVSVCMMHVSGSKNEKEEEERLFYVKWMN